MKQFTAFGMLFFLFTFSGNAQILLDENFDYPAGDSLTAHGWLRHSGSQGQPLVVTPGLTFPGYPLSGTGNAARLDTVGTSGIDVNKSFAPDSSNNVYAAFMVTVLYVAPDTGDYFFHFSTSPLSTSYFRAKVFAKNSSGVLKFGITKGANTGVYASGNYNFNTTYLLVVKYAFLTGSGTDDQVSLYIFNTSIPITEPATPTIGPLSESINDISSAGTVALRQGVINVRPVLVIDGVRVFKSWANIVSVIPISSIAEKFSLKQNYPNPFNPATTIEFSIKENSFVIVDVYDILGRKVTSAINENLASGSYKYIFDGGELSSGIYYYALTAIARNGNTYTSTKSMVLIK
jgi:hypothetical protein